MNPLKVFTWSGLLLAALACPALVFAASLQLFTISDEFDAPAPRVYVYQGEVRSADRAVRNFYYVDEQEFLVYSATYPVGGSNKKLSNGAEFLRWHVEALGSVLVEPFTTLLDDTSIGPFEALTFKTNYRRTEIPGFSMTKYGVVILKGDKVFQWSVTGYNGISSEQRLRDRFQEGLRLINVR